MNFTNQEIIKALDGLSGLRDKEMPVRLAYKVKEVNKLLIEKYNLYLETLEPIKNDKKKVQELLEIETEILVTPFLISDFEEAGILLTPQQAFLLEGLMDG